MLLAQSKKIVGFLLLLTILLLIIQFTAQSQTWPTNRAPITYEQLVDTSQFNLFPSSNKHTRVTDIAHARDDRLFIVEKTGVIKIDQPFRQSHIFLDIRDRVDASGYELGLFSLAFAHDFATSGRFFVSYVGTTEQLGRSFIISSFTLSDDPDKADVSSEQYLLIVKERTPDHNGGGLIVSPLDGNIYVGVGDDWDKAQSQIDSPKGKVLRLAVADIDWNMPFTLEPWVDSFMAVETTIVASGLRNPWQVTMNPTTGDLFVGEVGGAKWEEINVIPAGATGINFGWPCFEGPEQVETEPPCDTLQSVTPPLHVYDHEQGCSVIGGDFLPDGRYVFGDHCTREVFTLSENANGWQVSMVGILPESSRALTAFGLDYEGQIYAGSLEVVGPYFRLHIP